MRAFADQGFHAALADQGCSMFPKTGQEPSCAEPFCDIFHKVKCAIFHSQDLFTPAIFETVLLLAPPSYQSIEQP